MRACVRACVRARARACECVSACVRACVRVCVLAHLRTCEVYTVPAHVSRGIVVYFRFVHCIHSFTSDSGYSFQIPHVYPLI